MTGLMRKRTFAGARRTGVISDGVQACAAIVIEHRDGARNEGARTMWKMLFGSAVLFAAAVGAETTKPVLGPAEAIAAADTARDGFHGRFAIEVLTTGKLREATYLNSTEDYRSPDVLTFRLAPNVAGVLTKRYGVPAEQYLKGKRVIVEGIARRRMIVNREYGRVRSFNRWTHEVYVRLPSQVVAVE